MESGQALIFLPLSDCVHQSFYITAESISNKNKESRLQSPLVKLTLCISGTRIQLKSTSAYKHPNRVIGRSNRPRMWLWKDGTKFSLHPSRRGCPSSLEHVWCVGECKGGFMRTGEPHMTETQPQAHMWMNFRHILADYWSQYTLLCTASNIIMVIYMDAWVVSSGKFPLTPQLTCFPKSMLFYLIKSKEDVLSCCPLMSQHCCSPLMMSFITAFALWYHLTLSSTSDVT